MLKRYVITPDCGNTEHPALFLKQLQRTLDSGIKLVQLRSKNLSSIYYMNLAKKALILCQQYNTVLLLNTYNSISLQLSADGLHLDSQSLMAYNKRGLPEGKLLAASCHTIEELEKAKSIKADFVTLSPVLKTASHPDVKPLGWDGFFALASRTTLPVYALGGLSTDSLPHAERYGARGIAGIRCFWRS
ncbi:thiamine phosphate synthase [Candidatus Vallotia cooleyia]|uniref:thiamine phosphate synthase n=1 Tax=Candidatus Vallotiella adelgis TaxID=1177211 RepID=UPI001D02C205|nr:thiamine phosphate synthase [Candidatus Vallotia cooleyia]UDG82319.1 Thiamine-phosphate synthase [Candidatus Vallotia cooleyia]